MNETTADARREVLSRVRAKLGVRGDEIGRRGLVHSRLRDPQPGVIPERAQKPKPELVKLFQAMLEKAGASVVRVRSSKGLSDAIAAALREGNLPSRIRAGDDAIFEGWRDGQAELEIVKGRAEADDAVGLSHAFAAAAETGTLFLASGPENPSTLNFLPEVHFVVVLAGDIAGSYEECWSKLRAMLGAGKMPRTVNLVSGPSRTADIEQTIVMGAHGPKKLVVFVSGS
jgi:L-lactate dehydrogenase complex protein LldG